MTFYGFLEADLIFDTTRSYNDSIGSALVARSDSYEGRTGRTQSSIRNTRLGFAFESPLIGQVKPSAVLEADFFGHQDSPPATSENTYFDSPTLRIRQAFVKLENPYVNVLMGQSYDVFGWQNYFFPCSAEFLGLPNQLFSRNMQLRVSHAFSANGPISIDVAASAVRPVQRDGEVPDANAGVRLSVNGWKGITTPGNVGTVALPLSLGVSGTVRQFKVNAFTPPPAQNSNSATGWGLSVDALIPVIPAAGAYDRGNRLTLIGSFVKGSGISDLITAEWRGAVPDLAQPCPGHPATLYTANIDNGLVSFDSSGVLHTIDWQAFRRRPAVLLAAIGRAAFFRQLHPGSLGKSGQAIPPRAARRSSCWSTSRIRHATPTQTCFGTLRRRCAMGISGQYTQVGVPRRGQAAQPPRHGPDGLPVLGHWKSQQYSVVG